MTKPAPLPLSLANLDALDPAVGRPGYARSDLTAGILHIGVGNFHRAHMAVYLDELFSKGLGHDWAIVGAGLKSFDAARRDQLQPQDWLTTVIDLAPGNLSAHVTGAMVDFLPVDPAAIIRQMADPAIRIVSLTITEGGYFVDAATGDFDADHPDIRHDAANPDDPRTVFGVLLAGLAARMEAGEPPFTVLSCDNLPENGHVTRNALEGLAKLRGGALADFVRDKVRCPNSMVDRITPATTDRERALAREKFGIQDAAPVVCEPFRQWVMEENFSAGRPPLEEVGVQFVPDVAPFETMKLRILNAGHAAIAYPAALLGHTYVHEAMADPDIRNWLIALMERDVIPVLPKIEGVDFHAYLATCADRFANPEIGDTIARLCLDGSNRQPKFIVPTAQEAVAAGTSLGGLALEFAFYCRFCAATAEPGAKLTLDDERAESLQKAALASRTDPDAFLALRDIFGDLGQSAEMRAAFAKAIGALWAADTRSVLRQFAGVTA